MVSKNPNESSMKTILLLCLLITAGSLNGFAESAQPEFRQNIMDQGVKPDGNVGSWACMPDFWERPSAFSFERVDVFLYLNFFTESFA